MKIRTIITRSSLALAAVATVALAVLGVSSAGAATSPVTHGACVEHGKPGSVLGNWMLYDWNNSKCPAGTYGPVFPGGAVSLPIVPKHVTKDLGGLTSAVVTGGHFIDNATEVGTVTLQPGSYFVSVNAKATPNVASAVPVFPQFFVYNQAKNAAFNGDLFNVGAGSLATNNTSIDSYFSGSGTITLDKVTTLHVLAFGYDSDRGAGSYTLDDLTVTAVPLP